MEQTTEPAETDKTADKKENTAVMFPILVKGIGISDKDSPPTFSEPSYRYPLHSDDKPCHDAPVKISSASCI